MVSIKINKHLLPALSSRATANEAIPLSSEVSPLRAVLAHLHPLPLNGMEYVSLEKNVGGLNRSGKSSRQCRGCGIERNMLVSFLNS